MWNLNRGCVSVTSHLFENLVIMKINNDEAPFIRLTLKKKLSIKKKFGNIKFMVHTCNQLKFKVSRLEKFYFQVDEA